MKLKPRHNYGRLMSRGIPIAIAVLAASTLATVLLATQSEAQCGPIVGCEKVRKVENGGPPPCTMSDDMLYIRCQYSTRCSRTGGFAYDLGVATIGSRDSCSVYVLLHSTAEATA